MTKRWLASRPQIWSMGPKGSQDKGKVRGNQLATMTSVTLTAPRRTRLWASAVPEAIGVNFERLSPDGPHIATVGRLRGPPLALRAAALSDNMKLKWLWGPKSIKWTLAPYRCNKHPILGLLWGLWGLPRATLSCRGPKSIVQTQAPYRRDKCLILCLHTNFGAPGGPPGGLCLFKFLMPTFYVYMSCASMWWSAFIFSGVKFAVFAKNRHFFFFFFYSIHLFNWFSRKFTTSQYILKYIKIHIPC